MGTATATGCAGVAPAVFVIATALAIGAGVEDITTGATLALVITVGCVVVAGATVTVGDVLDCITVAGIAA
jgi:hypothetical protein